MPASASGIPLQSGDAELHGQPIFRVWTAPPLNGRHRFFCGGRCMCGPREDTKYNVCAWVCVSLPSIFFFSICAPFLWNEVSPVFPVAAAFFFVSTVSSLITTCCTDPGVLPKQPLVRIFDLEEVMDEATGYRKPNAATESVEQTIFDRDSGPVTLSSRQAEQGFKWCNTCRVIRPPRASHCADCNACVLRFDHHCPFVNNCVGQRNYIFFAWFLSSVTLLGFTVVVGIAVWLQAAGSDDKVASSLVWVTGAAVAIPAALLGLSVMVFCCYHLSLTLRGKTTKEALTGKDTHGATIWAARGPVLVPWRQVVPPI